MATQQEHILYLSYDGMTDPLGQSQVLPYLIGLSRKGYIIHLVSFEKSNVSGEAVRQLHKKIGSEGIYWTPLSYTKFPPVLSTLYDINVLYKKSKQLVLRHQIKLVHCRSYITGLVGLKLQKNLGTKFLFDMRGFWADERVDGKLWNLSNPVYKRIFQYFKTKEKEMLAAADGVVSLTHAAVKVMDQWQYRSKSKLPVTVIPCCADLNHFNRETTDAHLVQQFQSELGLRNAHPVISYLGAIGTWYMLDEMMAFFSEVLKKYPEAIFLIITREAPKTIYTAAQKYGIRKESIRIKAASRAEVPALLQLSQISLFFITPAFSKTASSPTKQGEIMGMGIPVICNSGIGDTDLIVKTCNSGHVIELSEANAFAKGVAAISELLKLPPSNIREGAFRFYALEDGINRYVELYKNILN